MSQNKITIKGARQHNLKNISLDIPRDSLVVITGLSGSGKSSLAFDTIYAEGQRRFVESLSAYARQFLGQMDKPDVDSIDGLSPAVSIDQKSKSKNPRSTVGTTTEIFDYLRVLYARIGVPHCPHDGEVIKPQTVDEIVDACLKLNAGSRIQVLAPVVRGRKGTYQTLFTEISKSGYARVRVNGDIYDIDDEIVLDRYKKHDIEVVVDRFVLKEGLERRVTESVEAALQLSEGVVMLLEQKDSDDSGKIHTFSQHLACTTCGFSMTKLEPRLFSFNSAYGACKECLGIGTNASHVVNDFLHRMNHSYSPFGARKNVTLDNPDVMNKLTRYLDKEEEEEAFGRCEYCQGYRLKPEALAVKVGGLNIGEVSALPINSSLTHFRLLKENLTDTDKIIGEPLLKEIIARLEFLEEVGLGYLTLDRASGTLSGGESQRIRLATQIGSGLTGCIYVLDEPSIGLHQRDNDKLIQNLKKLRNLGNTVIVVEHDEDTIRAADWIIDIGPGAGKNGGNVVAEGDPDTFMGTDCITAKYLNGKTSVPIPDVRRDGCGSHITIKNASGHNLKNVTVDIPLGKLVCVTGVSGSGKSTLIQDTLYPMVMNSLHRGMRVAEPCDGIEGLSNIDKLIDIDQSPIGRTPRSNTATYVKLFDEIRKLYALTQDAKVRGYTPRRFSFTVGEGRCMDCEGYGYKTVEMHFLSDVILPCETCKGKRYNRETLEVKYKGKNIADVLAMTVDDACIFFGSIPAIARKLNTLQSVGLGYITLGQPATTLSGGEAQRVKLSLELAKKNTDSTLYILDEPTTGLHFEDVRKLLEVLHQLVDTGSTVLVIEHNLDVVKTADWVIDMGPDGGDKGGMIIAQGTPESVAAMESSITGKFLKNLLPKSDAFIS